MSQQARVFNNRYELLRRIARGGMAEVFLAHDQLLDRPVALKVLFPELSVDRSFVERFRREAQAAANLSHPNIVSVYDWGEEGGTYFIVMEYVRGRPLSAVIRDEGSLLPDRAAAIGADVAAALAFAHRNGVVHRDVKPGNVLIDDEGMVKVTDFGIARAAGADEGLTQTGAVMGTATYFSPEQAEGTGVDARTDVYSLGVVLYEMVTGRPPFTGDSPVSIAYKHVREDPVPPRRINPVIPAAFESVVLQAMAKNREHRYASADELRADLLRFRHGRAVLAPPYEPPTTVAPTTGSSAGVGGAPPTVVLPATDMQGPGRQPPAQHTWIYGVLLLVLVTALVILLFFLGKNLGIFGGNTSASTVTVPNVIGMDKTLAESSLRDAGLQYTEDPQPSSTTDTGKVADQNPKAGTQLQRGKTVVIIISTGPTLTAIPQGIVGLPADQAHTLLQNDGFTVGPDVQQASDSVAKGLVIAVNPGSGTPVDPKSTTVILTVSTGQANATVPDERGKDAVTAAADLGQAGFNVRQTTEPSATTPAGFVTRTDPPGGTPWPKGQTVVIYVSTGPPPTTAPPTTTTTTPPTTLPVTTTILPTTTTLKH